MMIPYVLSCLGLPDALPLASVEGLRCIWCTTRMMSFRDGMQCSMKWCHQECRLAIQQPAPIQELAQHARTCGIKDIM